MRTFYETPAVQIAVAVLIFGNFIIEAADKQILAEEGSTASSIFFGFEIFFATAFGVELVWNMYGSFFRYFWLSGWNVFDFVIVLITVVSMISSNLPGISVLRLFRAFRVFRLFKRVESLKIIIEGVVASMPGVSNAFMILGILMGIWSIIGVEFFREYADEEFGNFGRAMFTMWQVMTMDGWASNIARPLLYEDDQAVAAPFFVSFTFIAGIVMTNVVVAILLEKYLGATAEAAEAKAKAKAERTMSRKNSRISMGRRSSEGDSQRGDRKLDKDELIELLLRTLTRKNLQGLAKDDVISIALMLWHHPSLREHVPDEMLTGYRVSAQHQSRSILLNIMQRGLTVPSTTLDAAVTSGLGVPGAAPVPGLATPSGSTRKPTV